MRDPAVAAAMAVFDKSASRTVANAQTAAWAVLRDYIDRLEATLPASTPPGDACVRHACKRVRMEMQARIDALSQPAAAEVDGPWKTAVYLAAGLHVIEADAHEWIVAQAKKLAKGGSHAG